jgi:hypothetical protein
MRQQQHPLEGEEILFRLEQPKATIGAIQDMVHQSAGSVSSHSGHGEKS